VRGDASVLPRLANVLGRVGVAVPRGGGVHVVWAQRFWSTRVDGEDCVACCVRLPGGAVGGDTLLVPAL